MSDSLVDVTLHVDEDLNIDQQNEVVERIRDINGVVGVGHRVERSHLFVVEYDPDIVSSSTILETVKETGVHAELIGL